MIFNGMQLIESIFIPEFVEIHRQERKWARRVMWKRYQRFDFTMERKVFIVNGCIHAHPNTAKSLIAMAKKRDE